MLNIVWGTFKVCMQLLWLNAMVKLYFVVRFLRHLYDPVKDAIFKMAQEGRPEGIGPAFIKMVCAVLLLLMHATFGRIWELLCKLQEWIFWTILAYGIKIGSEEARKLRTDVLKEMASNNVDVEKFNMAATDGEEDYD